MVSFFSSFLVSPLFGIFGLSFFIVVNAKGFPKCLLVVRFLSSTHILSSSGASRNAGINGDVATGMWSFLAGMACVP